jgi:hypothetical protein
MIKIEIFYVFLYYFNIYRQETVLKSISSAGIKSNGVNERIVKAGQSG